MPLDKAQLREIVTDVLMYLDPDVPFSDAARELVILTIATESHGGTYLRQVRGPANGITQMEPRTESDLWDWIDSRQPKSLIQKISKMHGDHIIFARAGTREVTELSPMKYNLAYQIAMCRMHYFRVKEALPEVNMINWSSPEQDVLVRPDKESLNRMAAYWKKYYNSRLGKGVPETAVKNYFKYGA